jgi:hypothetical protein
VNNYAYITRENVTQIGCQFSQLSVLSYTLSNEWSNIIFLCEAGLNNTLYWCHTRLVHMRFTAGVNICHRNCLSFESTPFSWCGPCYSSFFSVCLTTGQLRMSTANKLLFIRYRCKWSLRGRSMKFP